MILVGEKDDWTPADGCTYAMRLAKGPIELHIYPGAYHGFDRPGGLVSFLGHWVGGDAQATQQAHTDVENFLTKLESSTK